MHHFFTRYPVLNKKKELIGIFNTKTYFWKKIKEKDHSWQNSIEKAFFLDPRDKLNKALEKLLSHKCHLAIVKSKKKIHGIITFQSITSVLVGKIDENKK
jgi:CBS domain containing-hemolysin-like protein